VLRLRENNGKTNAIPAQAGIQSNQSCEALIHLFCWLHGRKAMEQWNA
jgi:hypothetical protein